MPELPEVEAARSLIEERALGREIVAVDDHDTYVCRPHAPGEIRDALVGAEFTSAHRQGKTMWVATDRGPVLGLHLGMRARSSSASARRASRSQTGPCCGRSGTASSCISRTAGA